MQKFLIGLLAIVILSPSVSAFRDVPSDSRLGLALQNLIERGVMKDGSFFRGDSPVPAKMFWEIVLRDTGFDPKSATFNTPLPPNIDEKDPLAQFLREAIRRKFIDADEEFLENKFITRIEAIKVIVKTKGLRPPRRLSKAFREKIPGSPRRADYLPSVEAAYASKILEDADIRPLRPYESLTRRDLVTWLFRYADHGERRSRLEKEVSPYRTKKSDKSPSLLPRLKTRKGQTIQIEMLSGPEAQRESKTSSRADRIPYGDVLEQIFQEVIRRYRFSDEITTEKKNKMVNAAITAMIKAVGDKYSSYIEPAKSKDFQERLKGKFEGIGAYVELIDEKFTINAPIKGSPAEAAGILPGDIVTHVDGESIKEKTLAESVALIKGPAGTSVRLTILSKGKTKDVTVVRGKITIPPITLEWKNSVPIIGLHQFDPSTTREFKRIITEEILPKTKRGIIIDLRNNPGGLLKTAGEMGEFFVKKGDVIFSTEYKKGKVPYYSSRTGELAERKDIVILTNKGTASASEILIGMLQDYGKAQIIGTRTLGKGTVQNISNYANGGLLKLTIAKWLTPKGRWIHEIGIAPDIEVADPTPEEKKQKIDRQLDRAVQEVLGR